MPTTAVRDLKRSMKRLFEAATAGGWAVEIERPEGSLELVKLTATNPPEVDVTGADLRSRRFLAVAKVVVTGAADTGAWYGVDATDADGRNPGPLGLDTVGAVERLFGARKRYTAERAAADERAARERLIGAERVAVREAYLERLADDHRYRAVVALAESAETPLEIDTSNGRGLYWAASAMTNHLTAVLRRRMAARALDLVGWPVTRSGYASERPGEVGTPITLGEALAKAVTEVLGHESSASADYEALTNAARDVLRLA